MWHNALQSDDRGQMGALRALREGSPNKVRGSGKASLRKCLSKPNPEGRVSQLGEPSAQAVLQGGGHARGTEGHLAQLALGVLGAQARGVGGPAPLLECNCLSLEKRALEDNTEPSSAQGPLPDRAGAE